MPLEAPKPTAAKWNGVRRTMALALGGLFFGLAALGAVLPLVPTTPFLLLSSFFLMRGSPRLHAKLRASRLFGGLIRDFERHRGIRLHVKVTACSVMILTVLASLTFGGLSTFGIFALAALAAVGLWVVLRLPTVDDGA